MFRSHPFVACFVALYFSLNPVPAAEPGLSLHFGDSDARVARQVALFVPEGAPASAFVGPGQVNAIWEGTLNLEARSRLSFTLEGTGEAKLSIDDEVLADQIGTASEEKRLRSGEHSIKIEYTGPADGDAQLQLFWEGREFGKEPVPANVFTHDANDSLLIQRSQLRLGHELIEQYNCNGCHDSADNSTAPSLSGIGERLEPAWLARWIADPKSHRRAARMPALFRGDDRNQMAADIASFLSPPGAEPPGPALPADAESIKLGGQLFHDQGCNGCHTLDAAGDDSRIGLGEVGNKYRYFTLAAFLREPAKHHHQSRMPDFAFDEGESLALEAFLRSLGLAKPSATPEGDPRRGERLFRQSGCINCHESNELASQLQKPEPFSSAACSAADFGLSEAERQAIAATLANPQVPHKVPAEIALRQFSTMRCAACHERDGQAAYRESFATEVAHLTPAGDEMPHAQIPQLKHLGSKLLPGWRSSLFQGEIWPKTRPWLKARMPAFRSRAMILSTGFSHAAGLPATDPEIAATDPEKVLAGATLTGVKGFACGTCHGIGDQKAIAVFEGEGPNLRDAGARLQREYFQLWMSDPPRMWPGTIMPKYTSEGKSPLTQFYDADAARQFDAIYEYIRTLAK